MKSVLFFDSGIGGLSYLDHLRRRAPDNHYVYVADRHHFPYGDKPADLLCTIVEGLVERTLDRIDPRLIVIACNTASVGALQRLRQRFSLPFVGVVPAIKPAALSTLAGRIAVLSTTHTATADYLVDLVRRFATECSVYPLAAGALVTLIEEGILDLASLHTHPILLDTIETLRNQSVDTVVLGCTHFVYLREAFIRHLGSDVQLIDSRDGVTRRAIEMLRRTTGPRQVSDTASPPHNDRNVLYVTGEHDEHYRQVSRRFGLTFGGVL